MEKSVTMDSKYGQIVAIRITQDENGQPNDPWPIVRVKAPSRRICNSCGFNVADFPSKKCVGCEAYEDHQR